MPEGASPAFRFGPFVLDVADRSLKRDGVPVALTPKLFDLLIALVTNAGRLVEKDTLLKSVWLDVAVEEGNLTKGIFSLRQLLEQEGTRYIETVPKRGYRFAAAVTREPQVAASTSTAAAPAGPPAHEHAASENSIAVMPFTDMSAARDQDFFCKGMSEEIINALGRVKAAATRALELDPQLAAGHTAVGYTTLHFDWNADAACREFDQAIALNPAWVDAHHWHSHALCAASRFSGVSRCLSSDCGIGPTQSADARARRVAPLHGERV